MTDQLTDDALAKRAEAMYYNGNETAIHFIFEALKVHRESLRLLIDLTEDHHSRCKCDAHPHIASIRELLGVSQ